MHPTPQGVTLDFEQYDKLKDVDKVLPTLLPELKNMLPCQFTHQNIEGAIYCSECHPNGPDFEWLGVSPFTAHSNKSYIIFWEYILKDKTQYNGKALLETIHGLRGKVLAY
jgi:hypothetical protein